MAGIIMRVDPLVERIAKQYQTEIFKRTGKEVSLTRITAYFMRNSKGQLSEQDIRNITCGQKNPR